MAYTKEQIANQSLLLMGADKINTFQDGTREADLVASRYDVVRQRLLSMHPWRFATVQAALTKLAGVTPLFGYQFAYMYPTDPVPITLLKSNQPNFDYQVYGDRIYSDAPDLSLEYIGDIEEPKMPAYFVDALVQALTVDLSVSLADDMTKSEIFERRARQALAFARSIDSKAQPNITVESVNFTVLNERQ